MRNRRPLPFLVVAALAAILAAPVFAQPPGGPGGPGGPRDPEAFGDRIVERLSRLLELTDAQRATLEQLADRLTETTRPLHEQMRTNHRQLETLLDGANPDAAAVGRLVIANHGLQGQVKAARDLFDTDFTAILTPEQKASYETAKKLLHRDGRRGPGRGPGRG
jgi:Spy/CpxP family protein refolding chaperone